MQLSLRRISYAVMASALVAAGSGVMFGAGNIHAGTVTQKAVKHAGRSTASLALSALDALSWGAFVVAVAPSSVAGSVEYETWASDQDIYVSNPCPPTGSSSGCNRPIWPSAATLKSSKSFQQSALGQSHLGKTRRGGLTVQVIGPAQGCSTPPGLTGAAANSGFPASGCVGEEVRRDRASFDYMVANNLWSKAGLAAMYPTSQVVQFPDGALEIKADWIPVATLAAWLKQQESFVSDNFYTSTATIDGSTVTYAMTSMHVSLKLAGFPDWVWADFENAYTPGRCDQTGCSDSFGAVTQKVPANAQPWQQYKSCQPTLALKALFSSKKVGSVFANYCLTGTQTTFGTTKNPTLLGSPIVEPLNADVPLNVSSCISCHAGASFDAKGLSGPVSEALGPNSVPAGYKGYDFMWGVLFAK